MIDYQEAVALTKALIERPSVTPDDQGCQLFMASFLERYGFKNEHMPFVDTENLWSIRGKEGPVFVFAGHTDVVPAGNLDKWHTPPFEAVEKEGLLFGRGAADMKASLAAMLVATARFVTNYPEHRGRIAFLITSDEEGPFINGTVRVVETLMQRQQELTWCIVGEPSSTEKLGDVIKIGRRGSLSADLTIHGHQGHVAYPHLAKNAIHVSLPCLHTLCEHQWDEGNEFFPPTSLQIANISAGTGAGNVIPGELHLDFNFRYSTEHSAESLKAGVTDILDQAGVEYDLVWKLNGEPFLTADGELIAATEQAIEECLGRKTERSTAGGTSDGRFIAPTGCQVVELGPINASIHKVNEHVKIQDIIDLTKTYERILENMLA